MKKLTTLLCLIFCWFNAEAQTDETPTINIKSASQMADFLRANNGIAKAVYLTQVAQQLSQSFASTEQLKQQWRQALETEIIDPMNFTKINSHALMGQTMVQFTNGMTLNRWRQIDLPTTAHFPQLNDPYVSTVTYSTWLNLTTYWQQILKADSKKNMAEWLELLINESNTKNTDVDNNNEAYKQPMPLVLDLLNNESEIDFTKLQPIDANIMFFDELSVALIRQHKHQSQRQYLPLAYDWIEIYQLIELNSNLLTAQEQAQLSRLIQSFTSFWTAGEDLIDEIDNQMYSLVLNILSELPSKFKNPDHLNNTLNQEIFTFITGVQNPATYFAHPLRKDVQENLEVCLNLSVKRTPEPPIPIAANQFESCLTEFVDWGNSFAKSANMAGNLIRLDHANSINRALDLPAVQTINNLTMQAAAEVNCQQLLSAQSNLVEWLMAAETVAWFHDRWPGLMAAMNQYDLINDLITTGEELHVYPECLSNAQPLAAQYDLLKSKWEQLKQEIVTHVNQYTDTELSANSDVDLFKSLDQHTQYIPEDLMIKACDVTQSCGAFTSLEPTKELLNLFPNHLKLAQQFGLGQLEICYDSVQWRQRKALGTHLDNNKIANFEGQLSIQLNGKFNDETVFTKSLLSEKRHVYLFGENNQDTLDLSCPLPIVGKQINTTLDRGTFGLLPNRLTFLTAQKIDINAVIQSNWSLWQNQINNQENQFSYFDEMSEMKSTLNDVLLQHVNELQQQIYRKLIANNLSRSNDSALSSAAFEFLTHRKLLAHMTIGLYPSLYASEVNIRAAVSGENRLVDMTYFRRAFQNQVNVMDMMLQGDENFLQHESIWATPLQSEQLIHSTLKQLRQIQTFTQPKDTASIIE